MCEDNRTRELGKVKEDDKRTIEYDQECSHCAGTGVYVGFLENDGAAVVCGLCGGAGVVTIRDTYKIFRGRKTRDGIKRVFKGNGGICIGETEGKCTLEDFGGIPYYPNWLQGDGFPLGSEMRKFVCPGNWAQNVEHGGLEWEECLPAEAFNKCKHFPEKQLCWDRYEKEMEQEK